MFTYTWAVTIESDVELSDDVVNVISDLKAEFADAVDAVLDIDDEFNHTDEEVQTGSGEQNGNDSGENRSDEVHAGQVIPVSGLEWW